jgi:hypothetical protein
MDWARDGQADLGPCSLGKHFRKRTRCIAAGYCKIASWKLSRSPRAAKRGWFPTRDANARVGDVRPALGLAAVKPVPTDRAVAPLELGEHGGPTYRSYRDGCVAKSIAPPIASSDLDSLKSGGCLSNGSGWVRIFRFGGSARAVGAGRGCGDGASAGCVIVAAAFEAPAVIAGLHDVAMMGQAVEQRGSHLGVIEHAGPFTEGEIGGDDDGRALVEPADEMEQKLATGLGERQWLLCAH